LTNFDSKFYPLNLQSLGQEVQPQLQNLFGRMAVNHFENSKNEGKFLPLNADSLLLAATPGYVNKDYKLSFE
jgi:hypothetical protein